MFQRARILLVAAVALVATAALPGAQAHTQSGGSAPVRAQAACTTTASPANAAAKVSAAGQGSTVCLEAGVFRGPLIVSQKDVVTIRGAGAGTIVSGGSADGIVIIDSANIVVEDLRLYAGSPANVYVGRSRGVVLRRLDIGAGEIGVHVDDNSEATISDSFIYAIRGDGVLSRRGSVTAVHRNWIFANAGVGVSSVHGPGPLSLISNIIADNGGPGVFVGVPPCAGLPGASLAVPPCFLANPGAYVGTAAVDMYSNVVQSNRSTGIVLFPGTVAVMRNNYVWRNLMTGLFAWGSYITIDGADFDGNEEHAIELRGYPDPRSIGPGYVAGTATITNAEIHSSAVYGPTGTLGGGVVAHGTALNLTNSRIWGNAGIGASYQNGATGDASGNAIHDNGAALCLLRSGPVSLGGNTIYGNATNVAGAC